MADSYFDHVMMTLYWHQPVDIYKYIINGDNEPYPKLHRNGCCSVGTSISDWEEILNCHISIKNEDIELYRAGIIMN